MWRGLSSFVEQNQQWSSVLSLLENTTSQIFGHYKQLQIFAPDVIIIMVFANRQRNTLLLKVNHSRYYSDQTLILGTGRQASDISVQFSLQQSTWAIMGKRGLDNFGERTLYFSVWLLSGKEAIVLDIYSTYLSLYYLYTTFTLF